MHLKIGPYAIFKRTEYSKLQVMDDLGSNITDTAIGKKILGDYIKQVSDPDKYFKIKDDKLSIFEDCEDIEFAFIPSGVTKIGEFAFQSSGIKYINFPDTLEHILDAAFGNCERLLEVSLPESVSFVGASAFQSCKGLETVRLPENIIKLHSDLFSYCESLKNVYMTDSVQRIESSVFFACSKLSNIKLSKNLLSIGDRAFSGCRELANIEFSDKLVYVGSSAFSGCTSLRNIVLPDSIEALSTAIFDKCENLEYVKLPNNVNFINSHVFRSCSSLSNVMLPDNTEMLYSEIFKGCDNVKEVIMPKSLSGCFGFPFGRSSVKTLIFNYDVAQFSPYTTGNGNYGLIAESNIDKLVIDSSVKVISLNTFLKCESKITKLDYIGTEEEFKEFKDNNIQLFDKLINLKEINFLEKNIVKNDLEKQER